MENKMKTKEKLFVWGAIALALVCIVTRDSKGIPPLLNYFIIILGTISEFSIVTYVAMKGFLGTPTGKQKTAIISTLIFFLIISCAEEVAYKIRNSGSTLMNLIPAFIPGLLLVAYLCDVKNKGLPLKAIKRIAIISVLSVLTVGLLYIQMANILGIN